MKLDTVSVIGLGYIGLPTAAVLASRRVRTIGVDIDRNAVDAVNRGDIHIVEPELDVLVHATVIEGWLRATDTPEPADAFIVAVPTPIGHNRHAELSFIEAAAKSIAPVLNPGNLVILESTSPVGTTEKMAGWLKAARPDLSFPQSHGEQSDIRVAHCPERVMPGAVLRELVRNDRIIGGLTPTCSAAAVDLYRIFVDGECIVTDARTAEMCKLAENSFRDVNIAFANELSIICDREGIDVWRLVKLANRHPRVNILKPGPGVGGHCIAVDPWFLISRRPNETPLLRTAREINDSKPRWIVERIKHELRNLLYTSSNQLASDITIACLGLAYKANIDDLRESPALAIAEALTREVGAKLIFVDPFVDKLPSELAGHTITTFEDAVKYAEILVLLVPHHAFRGLEDRLTEKHVLIKAAEL